MENVYSMNFKRIRKDEALVPIMDRGFLYGDSIYEAVRTYQNRLFFLNRHYERLLNSASRLSFQIPFSLEKLEKHLLELVENSGCDCYIRIIVTRGEDSVFDLYPKKEIVPRTLIVARPIHQYPAEFYSKGISLAIVSVRRNAKTALDPEIKSGNYLNNVLAIMEAKGKGVNDALMINDDGYVTECTTSNFFTVRNGVVITPKLDVGILHGVTRQFLLEIMDEQGIPSEEKNMTPDDVFDCDECFITATTKEIMPVTKINNKAIGSGEVGKITKKLMDLFKREAAKAIGL